MIFYFDSRQSESSLVETIWHTQSDTTPADSFISTAATNWEFVFTKQQGKTTVTVRGPETKASRAPVPEDAEFFGIVFKLGTYMPHLPVSNLVNNGIFLPEASRKSIYLHGSAWEIPDFENADTFVRRLMRDGLLVHEPIVSAAMQGYIPRSSLRSVQRSFIRATGLTHSYIRKIERAKHAQSLLEQGVSILDTVEQAGYSDQPHLTRALRYFTGQTPAQILRERRQDEILVASPVATL